MKNKGTPVNISEAIGSVCVVMLPTEIAVYFNEEARKRNLALGELIVKSLTHYIQEVDKKG